MSISGIDKACLRAAVRFVAGAAFCGVVAVVYYRFSHGITSPFLTFLWAIPLGLGTVVYLLCGLFLHPFPGGVPLWLYNAGVATLAAGSLLLGVLQIADATSLLLWVYPILGGGLVLTGAVWQTVRLIRTGK